MPKKLRKRARDYIPFPKPFPLNSFCNRTILKSNIILHEIILPKLGWEYLEISEVNSKFLLGRFRRNCSLGWKDEYILAPSDKGFINHVKYYGNFEMEEAKFFRRFLKKKLIIVDIGAHVGAFTIQLLKDVEANLNVKCVLVEPNPVHIDCLTFNIKNLANKFTLDICEYALGREKEHIIYTEKRNTMNSSFHILNMSQKEFSVSQVRKMQIVKFWNQISSDESLIIKIDTQGDDALIIAETPDEVLDRVEGMVLEVWATSTQNEDEVDLAVTKLENFSIMSWTPTLHREVSGEELRRFWTSKSGKYRNLYVVR